MSRCSVSLSVAVALLLWVIARIAGGVGAWTRGRAALLALGVACWFAHHDSRSRAARGVVAATLVYDIGVIGILAFAGIGSEVVGIIQWPAVALHSALTVWCLVCLSTRMPGIPPWD